MSFGAKLLVSVLGSRREGAAEAVRPESRQEFTDDGRGCDTSHPGPDADDDEGGEVRRPEGN